MLKGSSSSRDGKAAEYWMIFNRDPNNYVGLKSDQIRAVAILGHSGSPFALVLHEISKWLQSTHNPSNDIGNQQLCSINQETAHILMHFQDM